MRNRKVLLLLFLASIVIIASCRKNEENSNNFSGKLTAQTNCKNNTKSAELDDNHSCVEFSFDQQNQLLKIKHINAGFNCCPEKLYSEIWLSNDSIFIQEFEQAALCRCNCLYDLEFEISGVEQKGYHLIFIEPYAKNQKQLAFDIDLNSSATGKFCVTRKDYPWGLNNF